jgi:general secretion pathway protein G
MSGAKLGLLVLFVAGGVAALILARKELGREAADPTIRAQREMGAIQMAIEHYRIDTGNYPTRSQGLNALIVRPYDLSSKIWRGPYFEIERKELRRDPWDRAYIYRVLESGRGMVYTMGADGIPGGTGEDRDLMSLAEATQRGELGKRRSGSAFDALR